MVPALPSDERGWFWPFHHLCYAALLPWNSYQIQTPLKFKLALQVCTHKHIHTHTRTADTHIQMHAHTYIRAPNGTWFAHLWRTRTKIHPLQVCPARGIDSTHWNQNSPPSKLSCAWNWFDTLEPKFTPFKFVLRVELIRHIGTKIHPLQVCPARGIDSKHGNQNSPPSSLSCAWNWFDALEPKFTSFKFVLRVELIRTLEPKFTPFKFVLRVELIRRTRTKIYPLQVCPARGIDSTH